MSRKTKRAERIQNKSHETVVENALVSTPHLMDVLVNEVVRARVRFRALLRLLIAKGCFEEREYVLEFEQEEDASFAALADALLLEPAQVREKHEVWMKSERGRLATTVRPSTIRISLTPVQTKPKRRS